MLGDQGLNELQVVVERRGYGARAWVWRLSTGLGDVARSATAFVSAEDAYLAGRGELLARRVSETRPVRRFKEMAFADDRESFGGLLDT